MPKDKKLETIVRKLIKISFNQGKLNPSKVKEVTKTLSGLSVGTAVKSLDLYLTGLKRELDLHRLTIESPVSLTNEQITSITETVQGDTPVYETEVIINPELLAGLRVKIGDEVFDNSVQDRIMQLRKAIHG